MGEAQHIDPDTVQEVSAGFGLVVDCAKEMLVLYIR